MVWNIAIIYCNVYYRVTSGATRHIYIYIPTVLGTGKTKFHGHAYNGCLQSKQKRKEKINGKYGILCDVWKNGLETTALILHFYKTKHKRNDGAEKTADRKEGRRKGIEG